MVVFGIPYQMSYLVYYCALWNTRVYAWRACVWYASHVWYWILLVHHYPSCMYIISHGAIWDGMLGVVFGVLLCTHALVRSG